VNRHNKTNNQKRTGLFRSFFLLNTLNGNRKKPLKQKLVESQDVVCPVRCAQPRGEFSSKKSGIVFLVSLPPTTTSFEKSKGREKRQVVGDNIQSPPFNFVLLFRPQEFFERIK
jgi:hypothetical protein